MTVKVTIQSIVNSAPLILPLLFFALLFFQKLLAQNNVAAFTNSRGAYEAKHDEVKCNELVIFILNCSKFVLFIAFCSGSIKCDVFDYSLGIIVIKTLF